MITRMNFCLRDHLAEDCPCLNKGHLMSDDYDWDEVVNASNEAINLLRYLMNKLDMQPDVNKDEFDTLERLYRALEGSDE